MSGPAALVEKYLALHAHLRPVEATFMGLPGHDHWLPPAGPDAPQQEQSALDSLLAQVQSAPHPTDPALALDLRLLKAQLVSWQAELQRLPRQHNPTWYSGEAAFGLVSLLLPRPGVTEQQTVQAAEARLADLPRFLNEGRAHLAGRPSHPDWVRRAQQDCQALARFLEHELWLHPALAAEQARLQSLGTQAAQAAVQFSAALPLDPDLSVACGEAQLDELLRRVHGLPESARRALERAEDAYARLSAELETQARPFGQPWAGVVADLAQPLADSEHLEALYTHWHERALLAAQEAALLTPETDYQLEFRPLPAWAERLYRELYFLFYRSPAALRPGAGSVYWVTHDAPPPSLSFVQIVHAVHHGSVGHHTQNARARQAPATLARLGGTDGASALVALSAGTAAEGWACHAEQLLLEAEGFYSPQQRLLLLSHERRSAACAVADLKLHLGDWTLTQMRDFYRHEVGFPEERLWAETTRNSLFPTTRAMYWLGTDHLRGLRARSHLDSRTFHDRLLAQGHVPLGWLDDQFSAALSADPPQEAP